MTERRPTDASTADDRAWLRCRLDPVLDGGADLAPHPDAWARIAGRIDGAAAPTAAPVPIAQVPRRRRARPALLGVAAAVLLIVAGLVATGTADDGTDTTVASTPDGPTGWYAPTALPEGWRLETAWIVADPEGMDCTTTVRTWTDPSDADRRVTMTYAGCDAPSTPEGDVVDEPTDGSTAVAWVPAPAGGCCGRGTGRWQHDGHWLVETSGLSNAELGAVTRTLRDDPLTQDPLGLSFDAVTYLPGIGRGPVVRATMVSPEGIRTTFDLTRPGARGPRSPFTEVGEVDVEGQDLPVELERPRAEHGPTVSGFLAACCDTSSYVGRWPGTDVVINRWVVQTNPGEVADEAELEGAWARQQAANAAVVGALRPQTTDGWRAFLATATGEVDPRLLEVDERADLDDATTTTTTDAPGEGSGATTEEAGRLLSGPGVATKRAAPEDRYDELDGLEIRLRLDDAPLDPHAPVAGHLVIRNTGDERRQVGGCTTGLMTWALVGGQDPSAELPEVEGLGLLGAGPRVLTACDALSIRTTIDPGETATVALPREGGFLARNKVVRAGVGPYLGTLPGGRYRAVVEVPGRTSIVRAELPVEVPEPACPTTDGESLFWLHSPPERIETEGPLSGLDEAVLVEVDGMERPVTTPVDCARMRLGVHDGEVIDAVRG